MTAGDPTLALQSLRPNLASLEARYGGDSVELGNLLLTTTDLLLLAARAAGTAQTRRYGRFYSHLHLHINLDLPSCDARSR